MEIINTLLEENEDVLYLEDGERRTPAMVADYHNQREALKLLLLMVKQKLSFVNL